MPAADTAGAIARASDASPATPMRLKSLDIVIALATAGAVAFAALSAYGPGSGQETAQYSKARAASGCTPFLPTGKSASPDLSARPSC